MQGTTGREPVPTQPCASRLPKTFNSFEIRVTVRRSAGRVSRYPSMGQASPLHCYALSSKFVPEMRISKARVVLMGKWFPHAEKIFAVTLWCHHANAKDVKITAAVSCYGSSVGLWSVPWSAIDLLYKTLSLCAKPKSAFRVLQ